MVTTSIHDLHVLFIAETNNGETCMCHFTLGNDAMIHAETDAYGGSSFRLDGTIKSQEMKFVDPNYMLDEDRMQKH